MKKVPDQKHRELHAEVKQALLNHTDIPIEEQMAILSQMIGGIQFLAMIETGKSYDFYDKLVRGNVEIGCNMSVDAVEDTMSGRKDH